MPLLDNELTMKDKIAKALFFAWKKYDPHFKQRMSSRAFTGAHGGKSHPCLLCKKNHTWFGRPCRECRSSLELWCPCPKPLPDYICTEICLRCGGDIEEISRYENSETPDLPKEEEDALYDKYIKGSNYHLNWWKLTCKIEEPQINHLQEDRVIAEDKSQAEYLLNEALVRLGEKSKLRKTHPEVLDLSNWEIKRQKEVKFGWLSGMSIYDR
jgi:hypothetical protein